MIEIMAAVLTVGALMYHSFSASIVTILFVGVFVGICVAVFFRSRNGILFGLLLGGTLILGGLAVWRVDVPTPRAVFGTRAFDANVVSVDRRLDKTNIVVRDAMYDERLQVSVQGSMAVLPGDEITVRGSVEEPEDFVTDSGRIFGYNAYLSSKGIVGLVKNPTVVLVHSGRLSFTRLATKIRYGVADIFSQYISFPFDGVMAGMVVGYQGGLPQETQDLFRITGVLHVLVLSGYNITLLAGFLTLLLRAFPFRLRTGITAGAIGMIVLVSGAGVASVRAGIMGSIALLAGLSIRTYQPIRALFLSYILFFFISPHTIFADPGFHLSFLATLFMIAVLPRVEQLFHFIPHTKHVDIHELILLALCVPVFMLPYTMYFSGLFPLASPFANMLLAIVTPAIMISGIGMIAIGWIAPIAHIVGTVLSGGGRVLIVLLEQSAKLPVWKTPFLEWWGVVLVYSSVLFLLFRNEITQFLKHQHRALRQRTSS